MKQELGKDTFLEQYQANISSNRLICNMNNLLLRTENPAIPGLLQNFGMNAVVTVNMIIVQTRCDVKHD